jgi:hypothetical protein
MTIPFNNTPINFAALGEMGQNIGGALGLNSLNNAMQGAMGPDGKTPDFNKMVAVLASRGQGPLAAKLMTQKMEADALAGYRHGQLGVSQANSEPDALRIGRAWANGEIPGVPPPAAASDGAYRLGPTGETSSQPSGVPGVSLAQSSLDNAPYAVQKELLPKQRQTELDKSAELKVKLKEEEPTDWALVNSLDTKLDLLETNINDQLDSKGRANEGLRKITGNYELNGVETPIPNNMLPDVTQTARDASATLKTTTVKIGLQVLAEMRAASAQGASGMGQLAIQESEWLQQSLDALQQSTGPEQMARNLRRVQAHTKKLRASMKHKFKMAHGKDWAPAPIEQAPDPTDWVGDMANEPPAPEPASAVPGMTKDPRGPYTGPRPEGTVITDGQNRLIKQNGKWVPYSGR